MPMSFKWFFSSDFLTWILYAFQILSISFSLTWSISQLVKKTDYEAPHYGNSDDDNANTTLVSWNMRKSR
jgi:hypothetical protein